jgi:long-subunit fatty acid transport protein
MDSHDLNFFSLAYPFNLFNRNMIVTLNYQQQYNMVKSQTLNLSQTVQVTDNVGVPTGQSIHYPWISSYEQRGFLSTISPAIAFQVLPELYFGVTVNFWDDLLGACNWKNSSISTVNLNGNTSYYQQNSNYKFSGRNINLGMMYSLKQKFNFGLVYKTAFNADLDTTTTVLQTGEPPATTSEKQTMSMPASYGVGFAYRHSDNLSLSFDIYRTDWSEYSVTTARGVKNPLSGKYIVAFDPSLTSSDMGGKPHDTTQVRIGGEYLVIDEKMTIPIRVGVYYDPEPGQAKVDNLFGVSLGSGVAIRDIALDISYQYRWGNRVSGDVQNSTFNSDISQHTIMTSLIYHF